MRHEAIGVLGRERGQSGLGHHSLLQFNEFGVGLEVGSLVDIYHSDGDGGCGLTRRVDASGQGNLIPRLHCQHIRPAGFIVDRLEDGKESRGRASRSSKRGINKQQKITFFW